MQALVVVGLSKAPNAAQTKADASKALKAVPAISHNHPIPGPPKYSKQRPLSERKA